MLFHGLPGFSKLSTSHVASRNFRLAPQNSNRFGTAPESHRSGLARQAYKQQDSLRAPQKQSKSIVQIFAPMFVAGAILGPLLDGIHGTVHLLDYKVAAYDILGLHSSFWVAPLLGAFYAIIGPLHVGLDTLAKRGDPSQDGAGIQSAPEFLKPLEDGLQQLLAIPENAESTRNLADFLSIPYLALNTGVVASLLGLSAVLYAQDVPYLGISAILAVCALLNWKAFDSTRQGLALALLCGFSAPLSELVLINVFGLWQYPHPDIFGPGGVPSWVFFCYFFYTSAVGNLARVIRQW